MAAKKITAVETSSCRCGCEESVNPGRMFRQGHDQRLISRLAADVVEGTGTGLGLLPKSRAKDDVKLRITDVGAKVEAKLSSALADKFMNAAARRATLVAARTERADKQAARAEGLASAKPKRTRKPKAAPAAVPADVPETDDEVDRSLDAANVDQRTNVVPMRATEVASEIKNRRVGEVKTAELGLGAKVNIKVRGRIYEAEVAAMNQAGKVTVATYRTASGTERRVENPTLV